MNEQPPVVCLGRRTQHPVGHAPLCRACRVSGHDLRLGQEALQVLRSRKVDVALIDLHIPDVNGWTSCARCARSPRAAGRPMTGYPSIESAVEAVKLGARLLEQAD